jgi:hypothetical protein
MATGIFIGLPEATLVSMRDAALVELTTGLVTVNYSDSGTSVGKQVTMPAKERYLETSFALSVLNPTVYGERTTVIRTRWDNLQD